MDTIKWPDDTQRSCVTRIITHNASSFDLEEYYLFLSLIPAACELECTIDVGRKEQEDRFRTHGRVHHGKVFGA